MNIFLAMNGQQSGTIKLVDSTALPVCKNMRINHHKVMKNFATRSKTTTGWFYGVKLHLVTDQHGIPVALRFTTGNVDDRKVLDSFLSSLTNSLIVADAGYVSKDLQQKARINNNLLITGVRKTMKQLITPVHLKLLNMRIRIETTFSVLKERYRLVTSLPRSAKGYFAHYIRTIFGYLYEPLVIS